jgi:hypothetical protein
MLIAAEKLTVLILVKGRRSSSATLSPDSPHRSTTMLPNSISTEAGSSNLISFLMLLVSDHTEQLEFTGSLNKRALTLFGKV